MNRRHAMSGEALWITEAEVAALVDMPDAIAALERGLSADALVAAMGADRPTLETLVTQVYISTSTDRPLPRLVQSSFSGLAAFDAVVAPKGTNSEEDRIRLRFEFEGGYWMLTRIHLPVWVK